MKIILHNVSRETLQPKI